VVTDPDWLPRGDGLLFTVQEGVTFRTWSMAVTPDSLAIQTEPEPTRSSPLPAVADASAARPYERRLGFDMVQNGVSFAPGFGGAGAGQLALTDMLGNEQILITLANDSDQFGNFWDGWEGGVTYYNRGRRLNYGLGIFRLTQIYDAQLDVVRRERRVGVVGLAAYPFSKFMRLEGSLLVRHASDHRLQNGLSQNVDLVSNFVSLIYDNTRWGWIGPSMGSRLMLSAGFTRDLTSGAGDYGTLLAEVRQYHPLLSGVVAATRFQAQSSLGRDAQHYFLGGPYSLRGYERRSLSGVNTVLVQQEVRFPILQGMTLAIPSAWVFPTVNGAVFADAAWTWNYGPPQRLGSAGTSLFIGGGYFPALRWDWAWLTPDFQTFSKRAYKRFSVGFNF